MVGINNSLGFYNGFWIYSETSFEKLYSWNTPFKKLQYYENKIFILDVPYGVIVLNFPPLIEEKKEPPKKSLVIQLKPPPQAQKPSAWKHGAYMPFIVFPSVEIPNSLVVMDLRNSKDNIDQKKFQFPEAFIFRILNQRYLSVKTLKNKPQDLLYDLYDLTKPPLLFPCNNYLRRFMTKEKCFIAMDDDHSIIIRCFDLKSGMMNDVTIPNIKSACSVICITDIALVIKIKENLFKIYHWNRDYSGLTLLTKVPESFTYYHIDWFHPSIPFFSIFNHFEDHSIRFWIYSKKTQEKVAEISLESNHVAITGDRKSRIYSKLRENDKVYLFRTSMT